MDVVSACPLRVASLLWQPRAGSFALTVVCVATYTLQPGESPLATAQEEPSSADRYWNEDDRRSLDAASDLVPLKPRAEVLLVGCADAPGAPVRALATRLNVGDVAKSIEVHGDRVFTLDGELRGPAQLSRMPLRWERAAGGPGTANPAGTSLDAPPDTRGMAALPNLQPPGTHVAPRGDFIAPIGYGPIAPSWPGRVAKLHRHAPGWDHLRWIQRPLPDDIDLAYFNAAPPDQQLDALRANERIVLENLHPSQPRLATSLRPVVPRAIVERPAQRAEALELRADTLCIDTERGRCTLVWRGTARLRHPQEAGRVVVSIADPSTGRAAARPARANAGTIDLSGLAPAAAPLPFVKPAVPGSDAARRDAPESRPPPPRGLQGSARTGTLRLDELQGASPAAGVPAWVPPAPQHRAPPSVPAPPVVMQAPSAVPLPPERIPSPPRSVPPPPPFVPVPAVTEIERPKKPTIDEARPEPPAAPPSPPTPPPAEPPPRETPLPLEAYPIERCARIAASIARDEARRAAILAVHGLGAEVWERLSTHWAEALRDDALRDRNKRIRAYDGAYVAQIEVERGPIGVEEHARLVVASDRSALGAALRGLRLPAGAVVHIRRAFIARSTEDAAFGARVRRALSQERDRGPLD